MLPAVLGVNGVSVIGHGTVEAGEGRGQARSNGLRSMLRRGLIEAIKQGWAEGRPERGNLICIASVCSAEQKGPADEPPGPFSFSDTRFVKKRLTRCTTRP